MLVGSLEAGGGSEGCSEDRSEDFLKIGPKTVLKIGPKVVLKIGSGSGPRAAAGLHSFDMCASFFFVLFFSLFVW